MEVQIKENKIYASLKDKWLAVKPEEEVRQRYICRLVDSYGYDLKQMDQGLKVTNSQRGQGAARADIVIWKSAKDKTDSKSAFIVVECKAESVTIRKEDYYQGYNYAAWAGADFFVTTNLKETRVFKVVKGELPKKLEEIVDIPSAEIATDEKLDCCNRSQVKYSKAKNKKGLYAIVLPKKNATIERFFPTQKFNDAYTEALSENPFNGSVTDFSKNLMTKSKIKLSENCKNFAAQDFDEFRSIFDLLEEINNL